MQRKQVLRIVTGIFLLALSAFLLASLATHNPHEGPFPDFPPPPARANACGAAGAYVSAYLLVLLGWASYLLAAGVGAAGALTLAGRKVEDLPFRAGGLALLTVALMLGLALWNAADSSSPGTYRAEPGRGGGVLGILLAGLLYESVGATGALILLVSLWCVGLFLLAGPELALLASRCRALAGRLSDKLSTRGRKTTEKEAAPAAEAEAPVERPRAPAEASETEEAEEEPAEDIVAHEEERPEPEVISAFTAEEEPADETSFEVEDELPPDGEFTLPPLDLLDEKGPTLTGEDEDQIRERSRVLERTLADFNIEADVVRIQPGPVITMYELSLAPGTKVSRVESLADDLAIALTAPNVRIVAPLPGRNTIGIEVPNAERELVGLRELMQATRGKQQDLEIPLFVGKDTAGRPLLLDLARCPHLLVAGATGSGKSVAIRAMISSILMTRTPGQVQLLLIDPKTVEFSQYASLPHLICPILKDMKKAAAVLKWACKKMDERYSLLSQAGVRNLGGYNSLSEQELDERLDPEGDAGLEDVPRRMPHIVIIVDEFGELMMVAGKEVEKAVTRLSQKARAVGIHLLCATQRPSTDVITGLIRANLPARIAFQVSSGVNSRIVLDRKGAELLLGEGDMLMLPPGSSRLVRAQGTFVSGEETDRLVEFLQEQAGPQFRADLRKVQAQERTIEHEDELYDDAVGIVVKHQRGSVSLLQRRLSIGYSRAARLIDMMADEGIVGQHREGKARRVLLSTEEWEQAHAHS